MGGYDGMHLIAEVLKETGGDADGDRFIEAAKGMSWISPRGKVSIDPATRDLVQTAQIREAEKVGDLLQNVEFEAITDVQDPGTRPWPAGTRAMFARTSKALGLNLD